MQRLHRTVQEIADGDGSEDAALLKSVLRHLPHATFIVRPSARTIAWCNPAVEGLLGYEPDELVGQSTRLLHLDEAHFREFDAQSYPLVSEGQPFRGRYWLRHRTGEPIPTDHLVTPVETIAGQPAVVSFAQNLYGNECSPGTAALEKLSPMERQAFDTMRQGQSAKDAARMLECSPRTVEVHRSRVLAKLGYASTRQLMTALLQAKAAFSE